jgi:hypothetical protein
MALELLSLLTAAALLSKKKESGGAKGPSFPADNTAVVHPAPGNVVVPVPASSTAPPSAPSPGSPSTVPVTVQPAQPTAPPPAGKGVAPGTPEPGWSPYSPPPAAVVARARQVLSSGALRVTESDPTGRFKQVRYRRERNPSTGSVSVTAWRPAGAVPALFPA